MSSLPAKSHLVIFIRPVISPSRIKDSDYEGEHPHRFVHVLKHRHVLPSL